MQSAKVILSNINVKLNDWPLIENTLYECSILLDLLNMKGGDQKWVGDRRNVGSDNRIKGEKKEENVNVIGLVKVMNKYLRGTEKSKLIYNYSALTTQCIMNYVKLKLQVIIGINYCIKYLMNMLELKIKFNFKI